MKRLVAAFLSGLTTLSLLATSSAPASLLEKAEPLSIGIDGYAIGKKLTQEQLQTAQKNPLQANIGGTYKFKDGSLHLVADKATDRVVVIYREHSDLSQALLKNTVGTYIAQYGEPSTMSHDKMIYWFYTAEGKKLSGDELDLYKENLRNTHGSSMHGASHGQAQPAGGTLAETIQKKPIDSAKAASLKPFVSIKLSSDQFIVTKETFEKAQAYLIISSEAILKERYKF